MALMISLTTSQGFEVPHAYARITMWQGLRDSIQVIVEIHKDRVARETGLQSIDIKPFQLNIENGATMQQMYDALKDELYFLNAEDV